MICSDCGTRNLRSHSKCLKCGSTLVSGETVDASKNFCPTCGALNLRSASSCIKCSTSLTSPEKKAVVNDKIKTNFNARTSVENDTTAIDFKVKDPSLFPFKVQSSDIEKPFDLIKKLNFINDNLQYKKLTDLTTTLLDKGNFSVNAYAGRANKEAVTPYIIFLEGYCIMAKINSILFSLLLHQKIDIETFKEFYKKTIKEFWGNDARFDYNMFQDLYDQFNLEERIDNSELRKSRSIYFSLLIDVCAHELGHICLGHILRNGPKSLDVSRNQEREADSFASSVISELPFSDYNCYGAMIANLIFIWMHGRENDSSEVTTHPHSEERLMNLIRANKEQFQELGINEETIIELLPAE